MDGALSFLAPLAAGVALAAVAGLRAFLPLFAVGLAARLGWLELTRPFEWLGGTPALVVFGTACLAEVLADKFPLVDHALDAVGLVVRPLAGMVAAAAVVTGLDPLWAAVLGILLGGSVAGSVHLAKAKARVGTSLGSAGVLNPAVSLAEDVVAVGGAVVAVLWPLAAVAALALLALAAWTVLRALRAAVLRSRRRPPVQSTG